MLRLRVPLLPSDGVLRQRRPPSQQSGGLREQVFIIYLFHVELHTCNFHLFIVKARELRQQIRHKEDESLFQLGLHAAGKLTHGIRKTFDKV